MCVWERERETESYVSQGWTMHVVSQRCEKGHLPYGTVQLLSLGNKQTSHGWKDWNQLKWIYSEEYA